MKEVISTKEATAPIGPFSQAIRIPGLVFVSGQVASDPATGALVGETAAEQTEQTLRNVEAVLRAAGSKGKCRFLTVPGQPSGRRCRILSLLHQASVDLHRASVRRCRSSDGHAEPALTCAKPASAAADPASIAANPAHTCANPAFTCTAAAVLPPSQRSSLP